MFILKKRKSPAVEEEQDVVTVDGHESVNTAEEDAKQPEDADSAEDDGDAEETRETEDGGSEGDADRLTADEAKIIEAFEAWLASTGADAVEQERMRPALEVLLNALAGGCCDEVLFEMLTKGADYDRAVAEAETAGEIKGRNASIDQLIASEPEDDGVPHPGVSSGPVRRQMPSIFDIARTAGY